jgi:hypothetical protein
MIRAYHLLLLACITAPLLVGCDRGKNSGQPPKTLCKKVHERNRKCVDALVTALHQRMGKTVPADVKQKLAKKLGAEITKPAFLGKCRERTTPKHERARTAHKELQKCSDKPDCQTYATCFLQVMR